MASATTKYAVVMMTSEVSMSATVRSTGDGTVGDQGSQGGGESVLQPAGAHPVCQAPQLGDGVGEGGNGGFQVAVGLQGGVELALHGAQPHADGDDLLLRTVVQILCQSATFGRRCLHQARSAGPGVVQRPAQFQP
jgi:hypothetical protein